MRVYYIGSSGCKVRAKQEGNQGGQSKLSAVDGSARAMSFDALGTVQWRISISCTQQFQHQSSNDERSQSREFYNNGSHLWLTANFVALKLICWCLCLQYLMIILPAILERYFMKGTTRLLVLALVTLGAVVRCQYKVTNSQKTSSSVTLMLQYTGTEQYYGNPKSPIIKQLQFYIQAHLYSQFYFKISDPNHKRYEVPQGGVFPLDPQANNSFPLQFSGIVFDYKEQPFEFSIKKKDSGEVIFSTIGRNLIFSDKYIQIGTEVASDYLWGLGERFHDTYRKKDGRWTIFNRDRGKLIDKGEGYQTYGYFPFYLIRQKDNNFHINYFRSSNAMDVVKSTSQDKKHYLTYKVIGGVLDFRFFLGGKVPEQVVRSIHAYSGDTAIPPFWGLGYQQSKWGYKTVNYLETVIQAMEKNDIPLEVIWSDIDYLDQYQDFTIDESRFPLDRMAKITEKYHYVPIIDSQIKKDGFMYNEGHALDLFVKDGLGKQQFVGVAWPGKTVFPDFLHPDTSSYWQEGLRRLYEKVKFSGIWLDMNQYTNFCAGPCQPPQGPVVFDYTNDLPYNPSKDGIETASIPLNSTHINNQSEADVHVYTGFLQTEMTYQFLKKVSPQPFIVTRSINLGSNKYGFHWTGDNQAKWQFLRSSIADNFNNQLFGMQMQGADICGFAGNTSEELCARWFQLGSMYTFARNHNQDGGNPQQPYAMGSNVMECARASLRLRYSLLKHFYSLFLTNKKSGTIWRPLFFEFPNDQLSYNDQISDTQFMIGSSLMGAPIIQEQKTSRQVYFPQVNWYDLHTGKRHKPGTEIIGQVGLTSLVPLYVREGSIIFMQETSKITRVSQLNQRFNIFTAMSYNQERSNNTHKIYTSFTRMTSIEDYNNASKVDQCLENRCEYKINFTLSFSSMQNSIFIDAQYTGQKGLDESLVIENIHVCYEEQKIDLKFRGQELVIKGVTHRKIDIRSTSTLTKEQ